MNEKVQYWLELCDDDIKTAKTLLDAERLLHMGFFCHLVVEKAIKAIITHRDDDFPPKIHVLRKLAVKSGIYESLTESQLTLLEKLNPLQIEARYPEYKEKVLNTLTKEYCERLLAETEEFLCWTKKLLSK